MTGNIVNQVKDLLSKYSDRFSLVQEILQNADDAGATKTIFAIADGLPGDDCCLVSGPGLLILNNGPVRKGDLEAMNALSDSNKGNDAGKIGRFGLGMKSVFHVCEVFVAFGGGHDEEVNQMFPFPISPWEPDEGHHDNVQRDDAQQDNAPGWKELNDITKRSWLACVNGLRQQTDAGAWETWFAIWAPFRGTRNGDTVYLIEQDYEPDTWVNVVAEYAKRAMRLLPLMRNLEGIQFIDLRNPNARHRHPNYCYECVQNGLTRFVNHTQLDPGEFVRIAGKIDQNEQNGQSAAYFVGSEYNCENNIYKALRDSPTWPTIEQGRRKVKVEVVANSAICILKEPRHHDGYGIVRIIPCAYLPLSCAYSLIENPETDGKYACKVDGDFDYIVYVHGCFFVDSGRRDFSDVGGEADTVRELQSRWNATLLSNDVLPRIIPELERIQGDCIQGWDADDVGRLVKAVSTVGWLQNHQDSICLNGSFAKVFNENSWTWKVIGNNEGPVYDISNYMENPQNVGAPPWNILNELLPGVKIVDGRCGKLIPQNDVYCYYLPREQCIELLRAIAAQAPNPPPGGVYRFVLWQLASLRDNGNGVNFADIPVDDLVRCAQIWNLGGRWCSYNEIVADANERKICRSGAQGDNELRRAFEAAVNWNVVFLDGNLSYALGLDREIRPFEAQFCVDVLNQTPTPTLHENLQFRMDLLTRILGQLKDDNVRIRRACRYLVHGIARAFFVDDELFCAQDQALTVESLIVGWLNGMAFNERVEIAADWFNLVPPVYLERIGVRMLNGGELVARLVENVDGVFPQNGLPDGCPVDFWRRIIAIEGGIRANFGRLPIMPLVGGGYARGRECYYLREGEVLPAVLQNNVHILAAQGDDVPNGWRNVATGLRAWTPATCLEKCVEVGFDNGTAREGIDALIAESLLRGLHHGFGVAFVQNDLGNLPGQGWMRALRGLRWVRLNDNRLVAPSSIVDVPNLPPVNNLIRIDDVAEDQVKDILRNEDTGFRLDHAEICDLVFGVVANDLQQYAVGSLELVEPQNVTYEILGGLSVDMLPVMPVLLSLNGIGCDYSQYINRIRVIPALEILINCINTLSGEIGQGQGNDAILWQYMRSYMKDALTSAQVNDQDFHGDVLPQLHLVSQAGGVVADVRQLFWTGPQDAAIPDVQKLHEGYCALGVDLLQQMFAEANPQMVDLAPHDHVNPSLHEYLNRFCVVQGAGRLVAGFYIACSHLWDGDEIWIQNLLGNGNVEQLRFQLSADIDKFITQGYRRGEEINPGQRPPWVILHAVNNGGNNQVMSRTNVLGEERQIQFAIDVHDDDATLGMGINAAMVDFRPGRSLDFHFWDMSDDQIQGLTYDDVNRLLKNTLRVVVKEFAGIERARPEFARPRDPYGNPLPDDDPRMLAWQNGVCDTRAGFDQYWKQFDQQPARDVQITRAIILDDIASYAKRIHAVNPTLDEICRRLDRGNWDIKSEEVKANPDNERLGILREGKSQQETELCQVIREDNGVQSDLLGALRKAIQDYGYSPEALLFELFQNADDATGELRNFGVENPHGKFVVRNDGNRLIVVHWGRPINRWAEGHEGFRRDLEKMLKLFESDKRNDHLNDDVEIVGKFGLGFKTVFLVSDEPIVLSSPLRFLVKGGVLPYENLIDEETNQLYGEYNNPLHWGREPTVIVLPFRNDIANVMRELVERFKQRIDCLIAFANNIGQIILRDEGSNRCYRLDETELFPGAKIINGHGLCFTFNLGSGFGTAKLLMGWSENAPAPLEEDVPAYWVTAPLQKLFSGIGFALNANFDLDPGRTGFNKESQRNGELFARIRDGLLNAFNASWNYYDELEDENLKEGFYTGLWKVLTNLRNCEKWHDTAAQNLFDVIWGNGNAPGAYRSFLEEQELGQNIQRAVIPSGLEGNLRCLCRLDDIQYVLSEEVLNSPILPNLGDVVMHRGHVVSARMFLVPMLTGGDVLDLPGVIGKMQEAHAELSPDTLSGDLGTALNTVLSDERVRPCCREALLNFKFVSRGGNYRTARELLCAVRFGDQNGMRFNDDVELLKMGFAPDDAILSDKYDEVGLRIFRWCRSMDNQGVTQHQLALYAFEVADVAQKFAVLKYMCCPECGGEFGRVLQERAEDGNGWIRDLCQMDARAFIGACDELADAALQNQLTWQQKGTVAEKLGINVFLDYIERCVKQQAVQQELLLPEEASDKDQLLAVLADEVNCPPYSRDWLRKLLKLEMIEQGLPGGEQHDDVTVCFHRIKKAEEGDRTLILSGPNRPIPGWFSEEQNQILTLHNGAETITTVMESMSVKGNVLEARIAVTTPFRNQFLPDWNFEEWTAETKATHPGFLLTELDNRYEELPFAGQEDIRNGLPEDVRFVFGPPGTGKTYRLAELILEKVRNGNNPKILVVTPTNRAADEVVAKILAQATPDDQCDQWLTRFGLTEDDNLQERGIVRPEKRVLVGEGQPVVVVTTIVRLAYDMFYPIHAGQNDVALGIPTNLRDGNWDVVIMDEASMIPIYQIVYPFYKFPHASFIVAGDPKQIMPVVKSRKLDGLNVYTLVGLNDFAQAITPVGEYAVERLMTQYRSVKTIGDVVSRFSYGGAVGTAEGLPQHGEELIIPGFQIIKPLTVMKFRVERWDEGVYKVKRVLKSPYHLYSALFVFEYVRKLIEGLGNNDRVSGIGIVSPYRVQTNLMARLLDRAGAFENAADINLAVNTAHGFQGGEMDMIIVVLNPTEALSERAAFNNQNILNVAISRAKKYLVVLAPDCQLPVNVRNMLNIMADVGGNEEYVEGLTSALEEAVWGRNDYIEANTFPTGHQSVNVYAQPQCRFEARADETALDVQYRPDLVAEPAGAPIVNVDGLEQVEAPGAVDETPEKRRERIKNEFIVPNGFMDCRNDVDRPEYVRSEKFYYEYNEETGTVDRHYCEDEMQDFNMENIWAIQN